MARKHAYVSFTDRVAAIRIDPVRKSEKKRNAPDSGVTESFFISELEKWNDLNLASQYTNFARKCTSMAQTLPMLLYNQSNIFDLLLENIRVTDEHSAEPFLDLLISFARDLGEDFEVFYPRALKSCVDLIEKTQGDAKMLSVVELAFNCLAHMFKYLSRLLTTNLIPTYDAVLPLFGSGSQQAPRDYVLRFAAESISFLVRRAQGDSLTAIVEHIIRKVSEDRENDQFLDSSVKLFAATLKGPGTTLHSKTPILLTLYLELSEKYGTDDLASQVIVEALHHARKDTADILYDTALEYLYSNKTETSCRTLFVLAGLRKGDRVNNWQALYDALNYLVDQSNSVSWTNAAAAVISYSDMGATTKSLKKTIESIPSFDVVCRVLVSVGQIQSNVIRAFDSIIWPVLVSKLENANEEDLKRLALLLLDGESNHKLTKLTLNDVQIRPDDNGFSLFQVWWRQRVAISEPRTGKIVLKGLLQADFSSAKLSVHTVLALTVGGLLGDLGDEDDVRKATKLRFVPDLMIAIATAIGRLDMDPTSIFGLVESKIYANLMSCDRKLRAAAITLVKVFHQGDESAEFLLDQCAVINDLPFDLENARNIGQRIRTLASQCASLGQVSESQRRIGLATLHFLFGMLTARFQPVWTAVMSIIPKLAGRDPDAVCSLALQLISITQEDTRPLHFYNDAMECDEPVAQSQASFDCHSLNSLQKVGEESFYEFATPVRSLESKANNAISFEQRDDLKELGIKVLCQIPKISEKKAAHLLVPHLLKADYDAQDEAEVSFSFKERSALLELFSLFTKPEKLPQFAEIEAHYLNFLSSRHQPLQRLGLKCLLTIQSRNEYKVVRKYRDNLDALLDDSRFRDEITSFISVGEGQEEEGSLHTDDRTMLLPIIVRIVYGRSLLNSKRQLRQAALSSLLFMEPEYRRQFVQLAQHQFSDIGLQPSGLNIRKTQGYLGLIRDLVSRLKTSVDDCISEIIHRGIFPIVDNLDKTDDKVLRQLVYKVLDAMLANVPNYDVWSSVFPHIHARLIEPQLTADYGARNSSQVTNLMRVILTMSTEPGLIPFLNENIATALTSCLQHAEANESVVMLVLQVGLNLLTFAPERPSTKLYSSGMLESLPLQMDRQLSPECFGLTIASLNKMCESGVDSFSAHIVGLLVTASLKVLQQPTRAVPLPSKAPLLQALSHLLESPKCSDSLVYSAFEVLAPLFGQFYQSDARLFLSACYVAFGQRIPDLSRVGMLVTELNAYDPKRLGLADFDRRGEAFELINEKIYGDLSDLEWVPLVHNMLFFLRDPDEMALRVNSRYSLFRFLETKPELDLVKTVLFPALRRGVRDSDEKYRKLYVDILAKCARSGVLTDMSVLLFDGDEDADFFINIVHVQVFNRRRALQSVGSVAAKLSEASIVDYILPLIEHFVAFSGDKNNELNSLADDAMQSLIQLARNISENQFKSLSRRYVQLIATHPDPKELRRNVRLAISIAQATPKGLDDFVVRSLVGPLHQTLASKANEHENLPDRMPIAVAIAIFLKRLSDEAVQTHLPGKLTGLCQLLRSKVPELRDSVRRTLGRVIRILGPKYLKFLVSELSGALRRGGLQGHVLGYTVHSLLVELTRPQVNNNDSVLQIGDFDESARMIFDIIINDTFGSVGEEKEAEGYVTTAKKVKGNKGYDSAELLAKWTSLSQFGQIMGPLREFLMRTRLTSKKEHKMEELLRHLSNGFFKNIQSGTQDAVVLCYEIFMASNRLLETSEQSTEQKSEKPTISSSLAAREQAARDSEKFFTVRLSSRDWYKDGRTYDENRKYAFQNLHLLQTFSQDTLRTILTNSNGLLNVANVKGLVPLITKGLESKHEDMQIAALKLAAHALKLPVPFGEGDDTLVHYGSLSAEFIRSSPKTSSHIAQAALKFLTMLIRTKPEFELDNSAVAYILDRLRPDIEEPEQQAPAVAYVRAVLARKLMIPQVYDMAELLSEVMVTNQTASTRDSCRAAYLQFLSSFPMSEAQFQRRLTNLGSNLRYAAPAGRLSVLEVIRALLDKTSTDQLEPAFLQWFANLVLISVNDSDADCRSSASAALKSMLSKASPVTLDEMAEYCLGWLRSLGKNNLIVRGGLEIATMLMDLDFKRSEELRKQLHATVEDILRAGVKQDTHEAVIEWQLLYLALGTDVTAFVNLVEGVLLFPHPWVRARAARVFGSYFKHTPDTMLETSLLNSVGRKLVRQLAAPRLTSQDSLQIVKDLVFIIPLWDKRLATFDDAEKTPCVTWLLQKLSAQVRTDVSSAEHVNGKTGAVQVLAAIPTLVSVETLGPLAYEAIVALFIVEDQLGSENTMIELRDLSMEALGFYDRALGTTEYVRRYTEAKQFVEARRQERKAKRSIEVIAAPELAARKRMKRNAYKRDVRRHKPRNPQHRHRK